MSNDLDKRRELLPPNNEAPESWLRQYDGKPSALPSWPPPGTVAMVVVSKAPGDTGTDGDVITSKAQLEALLSGPSDGIRRLFFCIPRRLVLDGRVCQLTNEDFSY